MAKAKKGSKKGGTGTNKGGTTDAALAAIVAKVLAAIQEANDELDAAGLVVLTPNQRLHSNGRLHENEPAAMESILKTVDKYPLVFTMLAAKDHGTDPKKVETKPARDALARRELVMPLLEEVQKLEQRLNDDVLASGGRAKDVTSPAYGMIKANIGANPALRVMAKRAFETYGAPAVKAAATRAAKQKAK